MLKCLTASRKLARMLTQAPAFTFAKYMRDKQHMNVGVLGHQGHGKSTLTAAITKYLSKKELCDFHDISDLAKSPEEKAKGYSINTATLEYETEKRHFCHVDCPGHTDYTKNTIIGASRMDTAILVVGDKGADKQTREHLLIAKHTGVTDVVVYINKVDCIKDTTEIDIIEMEIRDFLTHYGFNGEKAFVVNGSALCALEETKPEIGEKSIKALLDALDKVPIPKRDVDKPFVMQIDHTMAVPGKGFGATGIVRSGKIKPDDEVHVVGLQYGLIRSKVLTLDSFDKSMAHAEAGDSIKMFMRIPSQQTLSRGQSVCSPGTLKPNKRFEGQTSILIPEEGGREHNFGTNFKPQCFIGAADVAVNLELPEDVELVSPGDKLKIKYKLEKPLPLEKGMKFLLREGSKTMATGEITNVPGDTEADIIEGTTKEQRKRRKK